MSTRDPRGFSLVEVLVASVVFVTGVAAALPLTVASVRATRLARETSTGTWLAWQKAGELSPMVRPMPLREERLDEGGRVHAAGIYVRRWQVDEVGAGVLRLVVTVHHVSAPGAPVSIATIRRRTAP